MYRLKLYDCQRPLVQRVDMTDCKTDSVAMGHQARPLDWSSASVIAIDVGKRELACFDGRDAFNLKNPDELIVLKARNPHAIILEGTGAYSKPIERFAIRNGIKIYRANTLDFREFRKRRSRNVKTDKRDAAMLHSFFFDVDAIYYEVFDKYADVIELLKHRRILAENISWWKVQQESTRLLEQHEITRMLKENIARSDVSKQKLDERILALARPDLARDYGALLAVKLMTLQPEKFVSSKKWAAYVGLKLHIDESGDRKDKRYLVKHGDPEVRRLLYLRAMNHLRWKREPYFEFWTRLKAKGKPGYVCMVALMNKIVRRYWAQFLASDAKSLNTKEASHNPTGQEVLKGSR